MIKAVLFDLDGTLVDTAPDLVATLNWLLDREGLPRLPYEAARNLVGGGARSLIERGLAAEGRRLERRQIDLLVGDFVAEYSAHIADRSRPFPEDYIPRRVRYAVNCQEGTLTLAAIGLFDRAGQLMRTMVVPPGASDPVKPEKGSAEAKWIQRACMF